MVHVPGVRGGNTTTQNYSVDVVGGNNKSFTYNDNGNCTGYSWGSTNVTYQWDLPHEISGYPERRDLSLSPFKSYSRCAALIISRGKEDRLVKITQQITGQPTLESDFTYDGFSRWVKIVEKSNGNVTSTKQFIWCGKELCEERDANDNVTKRFFADGERIGFWKYYYTRDHLGSVREMTSTTGALLSRFDYGPYWRVTQVYGTLASDFRYTGHYYHAPSGLHLALYRAYDADIGRWLNRDPIGEEGGINLYGYVYDNPVNNRDPDGRFIVTAILVGAAILSLGEALIAGYNAEISAREAELLKGENERNIYSDDPDPDKYRRNLNRIVDCGKDVVAAGTQVPGTFNNGPPLGSGASPSLYAVPSPTLTGRPGYVRVRGYYRNGEYIAPYYRRYPNSTMPPPNNNIYPRK